LGWISDVGLRDRGKSLRDSIMSGELEAKYEEGADADAVDVAGDTEAPI
jgi:hypothetical protein